MRELLTFIQQNILAYLKYKCLNFNVSLTNDIVSFEQSDPVKHSKDTDGIANSVDPDQIVPLGAV